MSNEKNQQAISLQVTDGLSVAVIPNSDHEFLMTTNDVAVGYGTSYYAIQKALNRNKSEFDEGKHFATAKTFCPSDNEVPHNKVFWTKRGIVRLGFFIKSERARLFRDWAEELVIDKVEASRKIKMPEQPQKQLSRPRRHNRLTPERLLDIMADVALIDDRDIRISITQKLMGGEA